MTAVDGVEPGCCVAVADSGVAKGMDLSPRASCIDGSDCLIRESPFGESLSSRMDHLVVDCGGDM